MKKPDELSNNHLTLEETKKRYDDLYDLAPVAYFTFTREGFIREMNLKGAELLGIIPQRMINREFRSFIQSCDMDIWDQHILSLFQESGKQNCELGLQREDSSLLFVTLDSVLVEKIDAKPQMLTAMTDITRIKQAQRNLDLSAKILGILNESGALHDAINSILTAIQQETGFDAVGIRLRSGDDFPYFVQNGFSYDFLLTENMLTVRDQHGGICRDKNDKASLECTCGLVISGKTDLTNPLFTPGGSAWTNNSLPLLDLPASQDPRLHPRNRCIHEGFCSIAFIPVRANREIVGLLQLNDRRKDRFTLEMIQFFEGISASIGVALMRKQADEIIKKLQAEQQIMLDTVPAWIYFKDKNNTFIRVNKVFARVMNMSPDQLVGKSLNELYPREQAEAFWKDDLEIIATGNPKLNIIEPINVEDQTHWVQTDKIPYKDSEGSIVGIIGFTLDITQRKCAEEEKEKLFEREQAALAEAEATRKLDHLKSEFLQTMSHELRTPLNAVIGFSELIKMKKYGDLNEKQEQYVNNISNSGKHLLGIVNDILDLVKVESGEKLPLSIELFPVPEAIDETLGFLLEKAMQKNIYLKKEIDPELDIIAADKFRFRQILLNLIDNAIKFSKSQGGTITIIGRKADDMAQFSVSDTGIGIMEENLGKLFSLFYQADSGLSRKYGGTGIGLSIIKQLVEQQGGRLWVKSEYGKGSVFTFTLPLKRELT